MKKHTRHSAAATLLLALVIFAAPVEANKVIEWNELAQQHIAGPPFTQVRQYAMTHIAVADAVVAIEGRYESFKFDERAPGASATPRLPKRLTMCSPSSLLRVRRREWRSITS